MIWIILATVFIVIIIFVFRKFSGEDERIKTFFRIYMKAKEVYPEKNEREILEIVVEEHIVPGRGLKLKKLGFLEANI